jgi:aerobic carbon-monoxide dehydrogenase small subunit
MSFRLIVNGEHRECSGQALTPLVDVLRDDLSLLGAKAVCREGFCGACTVLLDGRPAMSCLVPLGTLEGRSVRTVESLSTGGRPSPLQAAMEDLDVVQCGMCFPGMVVTLTSFLDDQPDADRAAIKRALTGNICRCTGYERIVDAALSLVRAG